MFHVYKGLRGTQLANIWRGQILAWVMTTLLLPPCRKKRGCRVEEKDSTLEYIDGGQWNWGIALTQQGGTQSWGVALVSQTGRMGAAESFYQMKYLNAPELHGAVSFFTYFLRNNNAKVTRQAYCCTSTHAIDSFLHQYSLYVPLPHLRSRLWELTWTIKPEMRRWAAVRLTLRIYLSSSMDFNFSSLHLTFIYQGSQTRMHSA